MATNYIDRTVKGPEQELLSYTEVAGYLRLRPEDFRERVEEYTSYPAGSNRKDIDASTWTWRQVIGMIELREHFEAIYEHKKRLRKRRIAARKAEVRQARKKDGTSVGQARDIEGKRRDNAGT